MFACAEDTMKNWSVLNGIGSSRKGEKICSQIKRMLLYFFGHKEIVHCTLFAQGEAVNQQRYLEVLNMVTGTCSEEKTCTLA
jgi:hypothetical protein